MILPFPAGLSVQLVVNQRAHCAEYCDKAINKEVGDVKASNLLLACQNNTLRDQVQMLHIAARQPFAMHIRGQEKPLSSLHMHVFEKLMLNKAYKPLEDAK